MDMERGDSDVVDQKASLVGVGCNSCVTKIQSRGGDEYRELLDCVLGGGEL